MSVTMPDDTFEKIFTRNAVGLYMADAWMLAFLRTPLVKLFAEGSECQPALLILLTIDKFRADKFSSTDFLSLGEGLINKPAIKKLFEENPEALSQYFVKCEGKIYLDQLALVIQCYMRDLKANPNILADLYLRHRIVVALEDYVKEVAGSWSEKRGPIQGILEALKNQRKSVEATAQLKDNCAKLNKIAYVFSSATDDRLGTCLEKFLVQGFFRSNKWQNRLLQFAELPPYVDVTALLNAVPPMTSLGSASSATTHAQLVSLAISVELSPITTTGYSS